VKRKKAKSQAKRLLPIDPEDIPRLRKQVKLHAEFIKQIFESRYIKYVFAEGAACVNVEIVRRDDDYISIADHIEMEEGAKDLPMRHIIERSHPIALLLRSK
jgi:hypothetical protein